MDISSVEITVLAACCSLLSFYLDGGALMMVALLAGFILCAVGDYLGTYA
jgi:hypothetical protein